MSQHRTYLVIEPGSDERDLVCPAGGTRTFEGESLRQLVDRVEVMAERDRAAGQQPSGLILVAGPDASAGAIELRARLMGTVARAMLPYGGELRISASTGRARLAALALLEWVREALSGTSVTVALVDEMPFAQAA
jgi:sulfate adenylyltransferase subunit 1 (EFTu-like GTPase family)